MEEYNKDKRSGVHFVTQVVHDLLDSGLNYLYRTAETRAGVTIQHGVFARSFSPRLEKAQKGVLLGMKTNALI